MLPTMPPLRSGLDQNGTVPGARKSTKNRVVLPPGRSWVEVVDPLGQRSLPQYFLASKIADNSSGQGQQDRQRRQHDAAVDRTHERIAEGAEKADGECDDAEQAIGDAGNRIDPRPGSPEEKACENDPRDDYDDEADSERRVGSDQNDDGQDH